MENRLKILKMLSTTSDSSWKIGKSDTYINAVSAKISALPAEVFNGFYIDDAKTKKISTVDFALMTYDMAPADKNSLMELYGIHSDTISEILTIADEIAGIVDVETNNEPEPVEF
ncbi:MAG: hypothetical protein IJX99_02420 [Clostridia bacterium]|nr:hypothetical protein [Clostridia bacterium]